jgi:hypothetical protein
MVSWNCYSVWLLKNTPKQTVSIVAYNCYSHIAIKCYETMVFDRHVYVVPLSIMRQSMKSNIYDIFL